jgi:hypothetical protein
MICQLVISTVINGQFVLQAADRVNKPADWFTFALMFQVRGLLKQNGTNPENELAPTLAAKLANGNSPKTDHNVSPVSDDKCDHGSVTPAASTTLPQAKTAPPSLNPTRTYDEDQETNTSKKSLKRFQSPSQNKSTPKNFSVTNHNGPPVLLNNLLTEMC